MQKLVDTHFFLLSYTITNYTLFLKYTGFSSSQNQRCARPYWTLFDPIQTNFDHATHRESGNYDEAIQDLNVALRMSPQHRELHKLILKVKEEKNSNFNNNDHIVAPSIGAGIDRKLKFADDSASEAGSSCVVPPQMSVLSNKKYTSKTLLEM